MIKICDMNPYTTKNSIQFAKKVFPVSNINEYLWNDSLTKSNWNISDSFNIQSNYYISLQTSAFLVGMNAIQLNYQERFNLGKTLDDILISCAFNMRNCNKTNDFEYFIDSTYGNCIRFNSGYNIYNKSVELKKTTQTGPIGGLILELLLDPINQDSLFSIFRGYNVIITEQGVDVTFSSGALVSPGYYYNIHLERQITSYPPRPYSNCTDNLDSVDSHDSDLYKKTFQSKSNYNQKDCILLCYNKYVEETCNCSNPAFIPYHNAKIKCLTPETISCQLEAYQKFTLIYNSDSCDCPQKCKIISYTYKSSMLEYPTIDYAKSLMKNQMIMKKLNKTQLTFDDIKQNVVAINIFYNQNIETSVEAQIKTDFISLISNIGGIMGLFLGKLILINLQAFYKTIKLNN